MRRDRLRRGRRRLRRRRAELRDAAHQPRKLRRLRRALRRPRPTRARSATAAAAASRHASATSAIATADPDNGCETTLDSLRGLRRAAISRAARRAAAAASAPPWSAPDPTADCDADEVDCEVDLDRQGQLRRLRPGVRVQHADAARDAGLREQALRRVCEGGYGDCDEDYATGCETPLGSTPAHCGACGAAAPRCCRTPRRRAAARATARWTTCASGWGDCDGVASNGCERNTAVEGPVLPRHELREAHIRHARLLLLHQCEQLDRGARQVPGSSCAAIS